MRDSAGYSIPHTGKDLYMYYSMKARNELNANRIEAYLQDTYHLLAEEILPSLAISGKHAIH